MLITDPNPFNAEFRRRQDRMARKALLTTRFGDSLNHRGQSTLAVSARVCRHVYVSLSAAVAFSGVDPTPTTPNVVLLPKRDDPDTVRFDHQAGELHIKTWFGGLTVPCSGRPKLLIQSNRYRFERDPDRSLTIWLNDAAIADADSTQTLMLKSIKKTFQKIQ